MNNALVQLLKNKEQIFKSVHKKEQWNEYALQFILVGSIGIAAFGAVMATYDPSWKEVGEFAWKMLVTVWGPIAICTPSLYVFSAIRGSQVKLTELVYMLLGTIATSSIVMLALAPVVWFFTWTMTDQFAIRAMDVVLVGLSLGFGLVFLQQGFMYMEKKHSKEADPDSAVERFKKMGSAASVLFVWLILLLGVTAQMAVELGPWFNGIEF